MRKNEYATMAEREQNYWWHLGRLKIIRVYVQRAKANKTEVAIMNIGCGTGGTIDMLESFGMVDNVDISDDAIHFMKERGYKRVTKVDDIELPFEDKTYDLVGAFDVLEHIDDQMGALKEWRRVLKDDGAIIVTVPAYRWLWTQHDVSLHHKRRYTTRSLARAAKEAGLVPEKLSYAIVFSLPLVVGFRFLNKMLCRKADSETSYVNVPNWVNGAFAKILYGEAMAHGRVRFPFGTSVVTILRKAS